MSSNCVNFTHEEFLAARRRYKLGIMDDESDPSGSSLESLGSDKTPLLPGTLLSATYVTPLEVLKRIGLSLVPPLHPSRVLSKPPVDPVGPTLVVTLLVSLLIYVSSKTAPFKYRAVEAILIVVLYMLLSCSLVFLMGRLFTRGRFQISFLQVLALLGYSLFGHLLSLSISYTLYTYPDPPNEVIKAISDQGKIPSVVLSLYEIPSMMPTLAHARDYDESISMYGHVSGTAEDVDSTDGVNLGLIKSKQWGDTAFLVCLALVTGPATLRVVLVLLSPIQSPPGRMVLGTILCLSHLLLLVILHASFLHPTFRYGAKG